MDQRSELELKMFETRRLMLNCVASGRDNALVVDDAVEAFRKASSDLGMYDVVMGLTTHEIDIIKECLKNPKNGYSDDRRNIFRILTRENN